jgi:hypothetical protein
MVITGMTLAIYNNSARRCWRERVGTTKRGFTDASHKMGSGDDDHSTRPHDGIAVWNK